MKITEKELRQRIRESFVLQTMNNSAVDDIVADRMDSKPKKRKVGDIEVVDGAFDGTTSDRAALSKELKAAIEKAKEDGTDIPAGAEEIIAKGDGDELLALRGVMKPSFLKRVMGILFPEGIQHEERRKMKITKRQLRRIIKEEKAKLLNEAMTQNDVEATFMQMNEMTEELLSALDTGGIETPDMGGLDQTTQEQMRFVLENISYELADILRKVRKFKA